MALHPMGSREEVSDSRPAKPDHGLGQAEHLPSEGKCTPLSLRVGTNFKGALLCAKLYGTLVLLCMLVTLPHQSPTYQFPMPLAACASPPFPSPQTPIDSESHPGQPYTNAGKIYKPETAKTSINRTRDK